MSQGKPLFITRYRDALRRMQLAIDEMLDLKKEFTWANYAALMTDADFSGENDDIRLADLLAAAGAIDAIDATLNANSGAYYKAVYKAKRQL